jgi:hypothetical protein
MKWITRGRGTTGKNGAFCGCSTAKYWQARPDPVL